MNQGKVRNIEDRQTADARECDRLRHQLYRLMDEWEKLSAQQRELERQFTQNDLCVRGGPRKGRPLSPRGRQRRLQELLELKLQTHQLQQTLGWVEQRRVRLLSRLSESTSAAR